MPNQIEKFIELVRATPTPGRELVETGAYPIRTGNDEWIVAVDRFYPVMDSYLRRSVSISSNNVKMRSILVTDFLTNEGDYPSVLSSIDGIGGAYVGTTRALSFTFPAVQKASHAFVVDYDAKVPFGFTAVWGALLCMAPTRAHFLSLLFGMPIPESFLDRYMQMGGEELIFQIWTRPQSESFMSAVEEAIDATTVVGSYLYSPLAVTEVKKGLLRFEKIPQFLNVLTKADADGRGGLLSSEAAYRRERNLFLEGRMTGVAADITSSDMELVFGAVAALGEKVGAIYVSNIEHWLWDEYSSMGSFRRIMNFYGHIARFADMGAPDMQMISSLELYPVAMPVSDFLARVAADPSFSELEAGQVYKLREIFIKIMRDRENKVRTPREFLKIISRTIWNVYGMMFRDAHAMADEFPLSWEAFDEKMSEASRAYRSIEPKLREKVLLFLMDAGVIRPPVRTMPQHRIIGYVPSGEIAAAARNLMPAGPYQFQPASVAGGAIEPNFVMPLSVTVMPAVNMTGMPVMNFAAMPF
jgi:hypothetical protein